VVARWLGAVSLIAAAEDAARARDTALNIVAVACAHSASEVMLGLIAAFGSGRPAPRFETFDALLKRALAALPESVTFPDRLPSDLVDLNDVRNLALHRGIAVADSTAADATLTTRALLELLPAIVDVESLPKGAGMTRAVAQRIEDKRLRECLEHAEDLFRAHDHLGAADNLSGALALVISRANLPRRNPFASGRSRLRSAFSRDPLASIRNEVAGELETIHEAVRRDEQWVRRIGLGQTRATLARLETILGEARWNEGRPTSQRYGAPDPSVDDVAWAMARVTEIVYRLWHAGSLELSVWEREQEERERATPAEAETSGPTAGDDQPSE
jgi:hypothetical protein